MPGLLHPIGTEPRVITLNGNSCVLNLESYRQQWSHKTCVFFLYVADCWKKQFWSVLFNTGWWTPLIWFLLQEVQSKAPSWPHPPERAQLWDQQDSACYCQTGSQWLWGWLGALVFFWILWVGKPYWDFRIWFSFFTLRHNIFALNIFIV